MIYKCIETQYPLVYAAVFEAGEELPQLLSRLALESSLSASVIQGVGAFSEVTLGSFDPRQKRYREIHFKEQMEVVSFNGNITLGQNDNLPEIHVDAIVCKANGAAYGGRLLSARVNPVLEVVITESPAHLRRRYDPRSGLPLLELEEPQYYRR